MKIKPPPLYLNSTDLLLLKFNIMKNDDDSKNEKLKLLNLYWTPLCFCIKVKPDVNKQMGCCLFQFTPNKCLWVKACYFLVINTCFWIQCFIHSCYYVGWSNPLNLTPSTNLIWNTEIKIEITKFIPVKFKM